eukprot:223766-Rhodomonas_salina.1
MSAAQLVGLVAVCHAHVDKHCRAAPLTPLPVNDACLALVGDCVAAKRPQRPDRGRSSMEGFPSLGVDALPG